VILENKMKILILTVSICVALFLVPVYVFKLLRKGVPDD